jgi:hypothetical protein
MTTILRSVWVGAAAAVPLGASTPVAAQQLVTADLAIGENGEFIIDTETKIAGITLEPGRYYVDHRTEGTVTPRRVTAHYVHFTQAGPDHHLRRRSARNAIAQYTAAHPGEIECQVEALPGKARKTSISTTLIDGIPHITRIEIAGEAVAHVF